MTVSDVVDKVLEAAVVPSFTKIGYMARSRVGDWTSLDDYDLSGTVIVITGGTSGLGKAAATQLARCGATPVVVGRTDAKNREAAHQISSAAGDRHVGYETADLGDYDQVRDLAGSLLSKYDRIDVLIHNAGALTNERREVPNGTELTVASQVVGPFLLTGVLLERLAASAPSRVLTMSSGGMYTAGLTVSGLQMDEDEYNGTEQYARVKRAQVVLNEMWAERFGNRGVHFHALHPGWAATAGVEQALPTFNKLLGPLLRTPESGADTLVWLVADDRALESNGKFWHDRRIRSTHRLPATRRSDTENRRTELWKWVTEQCNFEPR